VLNIDEALIQPPPALDCVIGVEFLTGVFEREGRFVLCMDVDRLLGADEADRLAALADQARARPRAEPPPLRLSYLCVRIGSERCAVPLSALDEITPCGAIARIPGAAPFVLGATNVRGTIVPVVDAALRYGLAAGPAGGQGGSLLLATTGGTAAGGQVALRVDEVEGLFHVPAGDVQTTPPFGARFPGEVVQAMAPIGAEFVAVLDLGRALADSPAAEGRASGAAVERQQA
jgi:purine-binding chemotaxis protein CheW